MRIKKYAIFLSGMAWISCPVIAQKRSWSVSCDDAQFQQIPQRAASRGLKPVPAGLSLRSYAPPVFEQGDKATGAACAFATAFTIQEAQKRKITDIQQIIPLTFSPAYLYANARDSSDKQCKEGLNLLKTFQAIRTHGMVRHSAVSEQCLETVSDALKATAFKEGLPAMQRINATVTELQRAISAGNPVLVALNGSWLDDGFFNLKKDSWQPPAKIGTGEKGHCLLLVGYNATKNGGSFELLNSYGANWGANGYFWMTYNDLIKCIRYAVEIPAWTMLPNESSNTPPTEPAPQPATPAATEPTPAIQPSANVPTESLHFESKVRLMDNKGNVLGIKGKTRGGGTRPKTENNHFLAVEPVYENTEYQIQVNNNMDSYVYIFLFDSRKVVDVLFPYADNVNPFLSKQDVITLPSEQDVFFFDNNKGTEYFCVLFSKNGLDMKDFKQQFERAAGNFPERLEKVLGSALAVAKAGEVKYESAEGALKVQAQGNKTVVPLIVEFEHK